MDKNITIAMPVAHTELARKLCAVLFGQPEMFAAPLGANKDGTPTHWVSCGYMPEQLVDTFTSKDAASLNKALAGAVPLADLQAMLTAAIVDDTGADPHALIRELKVEPLAEVAAKTAEATEKARPQKYDLTSVRPIEAEPLKFVDMVDEPAIEGVRK